MPETIEAFLKRASAADVHELWASIGKDAESGLLMLHVSPRSADAIDSDKASAAGIVTRSFYVDGDYMLAADETQSFAECLMHSAMSDAQKLDWMYTTLREYEDRVLNRELVESKDVLGALHHADAALNCVKLNGFDQTGAVGPEVIEHVKSAIAAITPPPGA